MRSFFLLEHRQPGLDIANLVRTAIGCPEDASIFTSEKVEFYINGCRFVGDLTRSNINISDIYNYYEDTSKLTLGHAKFDINMFQGNVLGHILASKVKGYNFSTEQLDVIRTSLLVEFKKHENTIECNKRIANRRGIFLVSRTPKSSDELFRWYITGKNSVYGYNVQEEQ
jgi:hypothetical protein